MAAPLAPIAGLWFHDEPAGVVRAVESAHDVASRAAWGKVPLPDAIRALHGLLIETCALQARLVGTISESAGENPEVLIDPRPMPGRAPERLAAARVLAGTPEILQAAAMQYGVLTRTQADAGALPAVAIVAIVVVGAAAVAYCAHQAATVVDRDLARDADLQKLTELHAHTMQIVRAHVEREIAAKKTLPLDDASKAALKSLGAAQIEVAKRADMPLEPLGSVGQGLAAGAADAGKWFGLSTGALLVVAAVALYLTR